jgi:hypothetical protein
MRFPAFVFYITRIIGKSTRSVIAIKSSALAYESHPYSPDLYFYKFYTVFILDYPLSRFFREH